MLFVFFFFGGGGEGGSPGNNSKSCIVKVCKDTRTLATVRRASFILRGGDTGQVGGGVDRSRS